MTWLEGQMPTDPDLNWRLARQVIAELHPGWTLAEIDALDPLDVIDIFAYADGKARAQEFMKNG